MIELYDQNNKLIATIHDEVAFSQLLDTFEENTRLYKRLALPDDLGNASIYGVNQALLDTLMHAAKLLRDIRKQLGDPRNNLYPSEMPRDNRQE